MAEARNSLHGLLAFPRIYRAFQGLLSKQGAADVVISRYLRPVSGASLLDVGCGPGTLLQFLSDVNYTGIDRNERYISEAQERYGTRGRFILGDVREMIEFAQHADEVLTGSLRLGVIPSIAPYMLPPLLPLLREGYPHLELHVRETQTLPLAIYDRVQANQLDEANTLSLVSIAIVLLLMVALGRVARLRF